ncbi:MAG: hypothetical protein QNJ46_34910 [Leptolyngbyaceae cyanobacterium MO_188.B28]|nr:hypothetical protein [Leptolyngbyaceae cyanobacterium MO_188.B28]
MISTDSIQLRQVGHLSVEQAIAYLRQLKINDPPLCQRLITYASVKPGQINPLHLGLGIDGVMQAKQQGITLTADDFSPAVEAIDKGQVLIERLLDYVNPNLQAAICALLACRAFNFDLYCRLAEALNFSVCQADFESILRFSWVWRAEEWGQGWHRVHEQLQQSNFAQDNEQVRQAHRVLEQHYWRQGNVAEAIYHTNQLDWAQGITNWIEQFISALQADRHPVCSDLLEIRNELFIDSHFQLGVIFQFEGDYFVRIAQYDVAEQVYLEAIDSYRQSMAEESNYIEACENVGGVFIKLGQLQAALSRHEEALQNYRQSISTYDRILSLDLNSNSAYNNKGLALQSISHVQTILSRYEEAISSYHYAIANYDEALRRLPEEYHLLTDQAIALQDLGELQACLLKPDQAIENYQKAVCACNRALDLKIEFTPAHVNKGMVLSSLGELQLKLGDPQQALESHEQAVNALKQALSLASDDIYILNHLGTTLHRLGFLKEKLAAYEDAAIAYEHAVDVFGQILEQSPESAQVYDNKGRVLHKLGFLQAKLGSQTQAMQSWQAALADFSHSLEISPNNDDIRNLQALLQTFLAG